MWIAWIAAAAFGTEWQPIDAPLRTGVTSPNDAAVVIGNEDYPFLTGVPYAKRDAEAFRNTLVYTRGVPLRRVRVLLGASNNQIRAEVAAAAAEVGDDGVLWIYFAGHGGGDPQTGERLLIGDTAKQDAASFLAGAVSVSELETLALTGQGEVVFVTDACYNGLGRDGSQHGNQRFAVPSYAVTEAPRLTSWYAAGPTELAGPLAPVQHGAFTYFVVGALRGWADGELGQRDGRVTLSEADAYVMRSLAEVGERSQTPQLQTGGLQTLIAADNLELAPDLLGVVAPVARQPTPATANPPNSAPLTTSARVPARSSRCRSVYPTRLTRPHGCRICASSIMPTRRLTARSR